MIIITTLLLVSGAWGAGEKPRVVNWTAQDASGNAVAVPVQGKISIVAFVRADQSQSSEALDAIGKTFAGTKDAQVLIVLSGQLADQQAKAFAAPTTASTKPSWPVISDPDFAASGQMNVHVWPTTVIVRPDGREAGHLAGLPTSYASDLLAYVEFAQDKIDQTALQSRLNNHTVIEDSAAQAARRRLQVATQLADSGETDKALAEIDAGLKLAPQEPALLLAKSKLLVNSGDGKGALQVLSSIPEGGAPLWQVALAKGRALVSLEQWDDAKRVLPEALKLNPSPSEAHYLLGIAHQGVKEFEAAAREFRSAFETCPATSRSVVRKS